MTGGTTDGLLTAGRFAQSTLLSAKALRIYAERGLLPPHRVDPLNGYRYYRPDQVRTGWLVGLLRSAGVSLDDIAAVVHAGPDTAVAALDRVAAAHAHRTSAGAAVLRRVRAHLTEETPVSTVTSVVLPDQCVLSVLRRLRPADIEPVVVAELHRLRDLAAAAGLTVTGRPFGVFHEPVTDDSDGPLEIALPVDGLTDLTGDVRSHRMPGGTAAARDAVGEETWFPGILGVYDDVHAWITRGSGTPVGPPREVWHNAPSGDAPLHVTIVWPYAP